MIDLPDAVRIMETVDIARQWRTTRGYTGKGGVVVLFHDEVQGWVNTLRDPEHWQAGCIAVDEEGHTWMTIGGLVGTPLDGAKAWRQI